MKYNNIVLTIIPEGISESGFDTNWIRASYCYLHGELQVQNGYDIFNLLKSEILPEHQDDKWISNKFPEGIYECICFEQPCTFFIWYSGVYAHGLVVFNSDVKALGYAVTCFDTSNHINFIMSQKTNNNE